MTARHRLANRRALETIAIEHDGQRYKISLGREFHGLELLEPRRMEGPFGPVMEVFINAQQVNSNADVLASDGAILMSLLLQHGCAIEQLLHSVGICGKGLDTCIAQFDSRRGTAGIDRRNPLPLYTGLLEVTQREHSFSLFILCKDDHRLGDHSIENGNQGP